MKTTVKALMMTGLAAISMTASAKITDGQQFGDWKGACQGKECGVVQVVNNEKGQPLGRILIGKLPQAKNAVTLFVTIPLGVNLRAGIAFAVDGKEIGVAPYEICTPDGCHAVIPLKTAELNKIKSGSKLQVAAFAGGKQQGMEFSLKGISAAIKAL